MDSRQFDNFQIITAGVYVSWRGMFPFQVGPTKAGTTLGVVRLGGHRERGESGWECAAREAMEEASIQVRPLVPPATYWVQADQFQLITWVAQEPDEPTPVIVTTRDPQVIMPMYLGTTDDIPVPSGEAKGLLLLTPAAIDQIINSTITLRDYLQLGGQAHLRDELPMDLVLEPYPHLKLLHHLLQLHPTIVQ